MKKRYIYIVSDCRGWRRKYLGGYLFKDRIKVFCVNVSNSVRKEAFIFGTLCHSRKTLQKKKTGSANKARTILEIKRKVSVRLNVENDSSTAIFKSCKMDDYNTE